MPSRPARPTRTLHVDDLALLVAKCLSSFTHLSHSVPVHVSTWYHLAVCSAALWCLYGAWVVGARVHRGPVHVQAPGVVVQLHPIKTCVESAWIDALETKKCNRPLPNVAFNLNLSRYTLVWFLVSMMVWFGVGAGVFSLMRDLNDKTAGQGLTLVHFSAQPEPFLTQNAP